MLNDIPLPGGIRSRRIDAVNGLSLHVLEAGADTPDRPCIILLHGFPELAYSWRHVMPALAERGFYVVAPDQRGYGRTTGWCAEYDADIEPFSMPNLVNDVTALARALGRTEIAAVVGHDFGSLVAAYCALLRPDLFGSVVLMSAPFGGPPPLQRSGTTDMAALLAPLDPPMKHYQQYYCTRDANGDMLRARDGLSDFLRTYFYVKSADWPGNRPSPLAAWRPEELIRMPSYYIMGLHDGMPEAIRPHAPTRQQVADCDWLTPDDLAFLTQEFSRTGFQGGLNWYRCMASADHQSDLGRLTKRTIDVPSCFVAGEQDWCVFQVPEALQRMQSDACPDMKFCELIPGAGHWVQQEKPAEVIRAILRFLQ